ncbi:hypothetical protein U9M48_002570 [Paspalum notatum var. saurae]|uniref:Chalcone synthase n=1 Tax=Paspalum notatum var. saurae TaxID=547442 RepID=A0AAQ3SHJ3_PASNO
MASTTTQSTIVLQDLRQAQRSDGPAAVLAIGTAIPAHCVRQDEFTDWYFRVTKSDHLAKLKEKMTRICDRSGIEKRYFHHTEETIGRHPEFLDRALPSLDARQRVTADAVAELATAAAARAIAEWGRPASDITHLIVATNSCAGEPGADLRVAALLGLRTAVRRTLLYLHGCSSGLAAVRVAKDIAENNRGSRVLVACAHAALLSFGAPDEARPDALVTTALFADGAGSVIVGADPADPVERPIFHLVSTAQATLPGTERAVAISLGENGLEYRTSVEVPALVQGSVERCLVDALAPLGLPDMSDGRGWNWNSLLWAVHPASRALLDSYESALGLQTGKLAASRRVLSEYGNMLSATIIFVLDKIRRRRQDCEMEEDDCQWGVMSVLGPGLTIETMVFLLHVSGCQQGDH